MEKAWDVKDLVARLKARGLDVAEEMAVVVVEEAMAWTHDSVVLSDTKMDDLALPFLPSIEKALKGLADKVNGKVDQPV